MPILRCIVTMTHGRGQAPFTTKIKLHNEARQRSAPEQMQFCGNESKKRTKIFLHFDRNKEEEIFLKSFLHATLA